MLKERLLLIADRDERERVSFRLMTVGLETAEERGSVTRRAEGEWDELVNEREHEERCDQKCAPSKMLMERIALHILEEEEERRWPN